MAVWSEWKSPSVPPAEGDWDFFVSNGTFVMKKLVSGAWVDVASWSAGGVGPAGNADTVDGSHAAAFEPAIGTKGSAFNKDFAGSGSATTVSRSDHAHSGIAGLTKNYYSITPSTAAGTYTADLNGHVPSGSTAVFIHFHGVTTTNGGSLLIQEYGTTDLYGYCHSSITADTVSGSCTVPLDSSYRFKYTIQNGFNSLNMIVTYVG